jgi:hypothetical protein
MYLYKMKFINDLRTIISRVPTAEIVGDVNLALPLKDLMYSRAYFSTFISQISREVSDSFPVTEYHMESFLVFFFFWTFLTIVNRKNENVIDRLSDIIEYKTVRKNTSRILFVLYILFCKNVDSVS